VKRWLLRLYPEAWQERYGEELETLLAERPAGILTSLDLVRGAADAQLHPELAGGVRQPFSHHLPGVLAAAAGLLWTWFYVNAYLVWPGGEWGSAIGLAVLLMIVSVPGEYMAAYRGRIALVLAGIVVAVVIGQFLPWSLSGGRLNTLSGVAASVLIGAGMLTLAAIRAGIGPKARWVLMLATVPLPVAIAIVILGGFGPNDPGGMPAMLTAILPYGIVWTILGLRMAVRGSRTISDDPPQPRAIEEPAR
jgi:hypothetical protein